jgi:GH24 family phage-related lysozyme (muramidase)
VENRFIEMDEYLEQFTRTKKRHRNTLTHLPEPNGSNSYSISKSFEWSVPFSVQNRVLVVLMENGGVDLGLPQLVDKLLTALHVNFVPDTIKQKVAGYLNEKFKSLTDNLLESAELTINRYSSAKPTLFGDVIVLRNGSATFQQLKDTLVRLSKEKKVIDIFILTHGSDKYIALSGGDGVDEGKIAAIKTANGAPLNIRSVYMMNCVGSTLNKAWLDAGAKVSSGAIRNNYLPEPTMFFFWNAWKGGQNFETSVTGAYRKTINLMNDTVKSVFGKIPLLSSYVSSINFENYDFVKDSSPVIQGQRSLTISSDELNFTQSLYNSMATTVLPVSTLQSLTVSRSLEADTSRPWKTSKHGIELIKKFEGFRSQMYNDPAGNCTIGYGTLLHQGACNGAESENQFKEGISEEKATDLLMQKIKQFEETINDQVKVDLNQNQVDALVSFTYNVGIGNFNDSTLLKVLNQKKYEDVPSEIKKWTKAKKDGKMVELPVLVNRRNAEATLFAMSAIANAQSIIDNFSHPFYDTGEHALFGEFIDNVHSGPLVNVAPLQPSTTFNINTVAFTYGQIITMGDLYDKYEDFKKAPVAELTRVKKLVEKDEAHYRNTVLHLGRFVEGVPNKDWGDNTIGIGRRYIDLALLNNSHFAPPPSGVSSAQKNNRTEWEYYHKQAIDAARNGMPLDQVYPVNAFGDHFLTDAFSAGHLINKEIVMNKFIDNVITNGKINDAGDKLFEKVAAGALAISDVKKELAKYEVTETHWYLAGKHLNLDDTVPVHVFYRVLKGIMEDTDHGGRKQIAGLAAKAIHDFLNTYQSNGKKGVPVKNNKGMSWSLTGDTTLDWNAGNHVNNLEIIQQAVKQSVENIQDAVANKSTPLSVYFQKVWDYVPVLTDPTTKAIIDNAIAVYTNPSSQPLIDKSISLVKDEIKTLLKALEDANKIRSINTTRWG